MKSLTKWLSVSSEPTKTRKKWMNICLWNLSNFTRVIRIWLQHIQIHYNRSELEAQVLVCLCDAEEVVQLLKRHTLNLINNGYKNLILRMIDADILVLLISYNRQVRLNDIEIREYLINLDKYYNVKQIIWELGSDIFLAFPSWCFQWMCKGKNVKYMILELKVKRKMISLMFRQASGKVYRCNICWHWYTQEFCVTAVQIETWHTRCCSIVNISKVHR